VYATCTVRHEENEEVVREFLDAHPEFRQVEAPVAAELRRGPALATLPHRHGTDGFYAAVLERRSG
jgi:16S rRNA (cytosine967-C5)-methyltransferase